MITVSVMSPTEPIEIDPSLPLLRATWTEVARHLMLVGERWLYEAMPVDLQSTAKGSLRSRLGEANMVLRLVSRVSGLDVSGWEIRAWNPEEFRVTNSITLIAVDPDGIGHDISALADGRDTGDKP